MNTELWSKIRAFDLDLPFSDYGFSIRLAKENFWTRDFTARAIDEYKKFMYLAATSDQMVSPSGVVDTVWHQHLVFTQSYTDFCGILGKTIQHVPSTHSRVDFDKFRAARERTQKLYKAAFGEMPAEVWSHSSMYDSLELPKAGIKIRSFILIGLLVLLLLAAPLYLLLSPWYITLDSTEFLTGFVSVFVGAMLLLTVVTRVYMKKVMMRMKPNAFIFWLHPTEVLYLEKGTNEQVAHDAIHRLVRDGKVSINTSGRFEVVPGTVAGTPEEFAVLDVVSTKKNGKYTDIKSWLLRKPVFTNVPNCMDALRKYVVKSKAFGYLFYLNFGVMGLVLVGGFIRLATGVLRDRPVSLIAMLLFVFFLISILRLYRITHLFGNVTVPGVYRSKVVPAGSPVAPLQDWQFFLLGTAALVPAFLPFVSRTADTGSSSDWGSSTSSSSSDSSCGSSCGSSCSSCGGCGGGD